MLASEKSIKDIFWFRQFLVRWFSYGLISVSTFMIILGLAMNESHVFFSFFVALFSALPLILLNKKKNFEASMVLLLGLTIVMMYRSLEIRSTGTAMFLVILLILAGILTNGKMIHFLFCLNMGFVVFAATMGIFDWSQTTNIETGLYYSNTVSDLIPMLCLGYITSLIIYKVLLGTIKRQRSEERRVGERV